VVQGEADRLSQLLSLRGLKQSEQALSSILNCCTSSLAADSAADYEQPNSIIGSTCSGSPSSKLSPSLWPTMHVHAFVCVYCAASCLLALRRT